MRLIKELLRTLVVGSFALPVLVTGSAAAQQSGSVISGFAVDSIRGAALSGAIVRVAGTELTATSDGAGRFKIAGVPAGKHRLEVVHPLLDTLRLALRTIPRETNGSDSLFLIVSTPSPARLARLKCSVEEQRPGTSVAIGFVMYAGTEEPAMGATVIVAWTEYEVGRRTLRQVAHSRSGIAGSDGSYKICGIPGDLSTDLFAAMGDDTTAAVPADFTSGVSIVSLRVSPLAPATRVRETAHLLGRVIDSVGKPIGGARVAADNERAVTLTRDDGSFDLGGVRPGTRSVVVRRLGYLPVMRSFEIALQPAPPVDIRLATYVPVLETVRISARRDFALERVGFSSRNKSTGGKFIALDELERRRPRRLGDALSMVPSLRTYYDERGERIITGRRGDCVRYFIDGHRWSEYGEGPDTFISGYEIGAIEVYTGLTAPPQFMAHARDGTACSIIVLWTKTKLRI